MPRSTATGGRWPRSSRVGSATTGPCPPACWPTSVFYGSVPDVRAPGPPRSSPTARTPRASLVGCSLPAGSRRWSRRRRTRSPPVNARAPSAGGCPTWTRPPTRASSKVEPESYRQLDRPGRLPFPPVRGTSGAHLEPFPVGVHGEDLLASSRSPLRVICDRPALGAVVAQDEEVPHRLAQHLDAVGVERVRPHHRNMTGAGPHLHAHDGVVPVAVVPLPRLAEVVDVPVRDVVDTNADQTCRLPVEVVPRAHEANDASIPHRKWETRCSGLRHVRHPASPAGRPPPRPVARSRTRCR